jgi:hypothetical protein
MKTQKLLKLVITPDDRVAIFDKERSFFEVFNLEGELKQLMGGSHTKYVYGHVTPYEELHLEKFGERVKGGW